MLHFVLVAFGSTRIAGLGACARDLLTEGAPPRQEARKKTAKVRAIAVDADAFDERFDVVLVEAGVRAVLTCLRAFVASFDTARDAFLIHE